MKKAVLVAGFLLFIAAPTAAVFTPVAASAAGPLVCERAFLGIPPWYRGLTEKTTNSVGVETCSIVSPTTLKNGLQSFITIIVLNVIQIGLTLVGILAFFLILFGGFQFLTGGSNPSQIEKARKTITNAVIGMIIAIGAVAIVNLIFGIIKP